MVEVNPTDGAGSISEGYAEDLDVIDRFPRNFGVLSPREREVTFGVAIKSREKNGLRGMSHESRPGARARSPTSRVSVSAS